MMNDLISREELLKRSHTVVVEDMWHMHQEIEVVNVDDIKKLQPQEEPLLDNIRAEIEVLKNAPPCFDNMFEYKCAVDDVLDIIDKYKAESEDKE